MNEKEFFQKLREDDGVAELMNACDNTVKQLVTLLHNHVTDPQVRDAIGQIAAQYGQQSNNIKAQVHSAPALFSGKGPAARRLAITTAALEFFYPADPQTHKSREILDRFSYKFSTHPFALQQLTRFVDDVRKEANERIWTTTMFQPEEAYAGYDSIQSIIFAPIGRSGHANIGLHSRPKFDGDYGIAVVMNTGEPTQFFYYHPLEDQWVRTGGELLLDGMLPRLRAEYAIAVKNASQVTAVFDFEAELVELQQKAHALFDSEEFLPKDFFIDNDAAFQRFGESGSNITIRVRDKGLYWWNTRWPTPGREFRLMRSLGSENGTGTIMTVQPQDLGERDQRDLVAKARAVMSDLASRISVAAK